MKYTTIITIAEAAELVAAGECRIFDCSFDLTNPDKGRGIYATAHVPGARYLHLDDDLAGPTDGTNGRHPLPDPGVFAEKLRQAGLNSSEHVIAYDNAGGPFAARLWWLMRWLGHDTVSVMDGNIAQWRGECYAVESGRPTVTERGNFEPVIIRRDEVVDAAIVLDNISTNNAVVVDARSLPRFRGEVLVMDAVAGHIPGARNRPYTDNLTADTRFKSPDILRYEFESIIGGFLPAEVILQCGSGVTACHNALAMEHAGLIGARLYPGSWSEWTSDPSRPIELGDANNPSPA